MFIPSCYHEPTISEISTFEAFDLISPAMNALVAKAFAGEKRGKNEDEKWETVNEIMMFNLQMVIASQDMKKQLAWDGTFDINKIEEKYKINCARKHFACKGFDIDPLLQHYGLTKLGLTGLDFMSLEDSDNVWEIG